VSLSLGLDFRDTEIQELHQLDVLFCFDQHDIARFDVSVDHSAHMGMTERRTRLVENCQELALFEATIVAEQLLEAATVEVLHDDEGQLLFRKTVIEDPDDILVPERHGGFELLLKSLLGFLALGRAFVEQVLVQNFDSYSLSDLQILGFVNSAHAA